MFNRINILTGSVLIVFAAGTIGCGQAFEGVRSVDEAAKIQAAHDAMTKAEEANAEAVAAMAEADEALKTIQDSKGNININLFKKSKSTDVETQFLVTPIIDKLRKVFDTVFDRVTLVKMKFEEARTKLNDVLATLSASNPQHAALIAQIQSKLAGIDQLEAQFSSKLHLLAGKLDLAVVALDKIIKGVTSFIPGFGSLIGLALDFLVMDEVKQFIMEIKMRLLAL